MSIQAQCEAEVTDLLRFFEQWYAGELPETNEVFARFEIVLAPSFQIITPDARVIDRQSILALVRRAHPSAAETGQAGGSKYAVRNYRHRLTIDRIGLVTYEEWQTHGAETRPRLSTALLQAKPDTPHGVEWLHVHETWMPNTEAV